VEQVERRHLGLYFNCDEKYSRGHNRFCKRIFFVDGVEIDDTDDAANAGDREAPCFSLQAAVSVPMADTMQLTVVLGAASLVALLDSGSTHNFISEEAARRSGLPLYQRPRLMAMVANGERITYAGVICDVPLLIPGAPFLADLFVMPLAGYDIVLGTKWLGALGPSSGTLPTGACRSSMRVAPSHGWECAQRLARSWAPWQPVSRTWRPFWTRLRVFATPIGLPPKRTHDHRILLKLNAQPVAVRPYRYSVALKDKLERQCATMIEQRFVRHSDSPFSLPVLLVKKFDGSWCFCIDYWALNAMTIKDAFSIPVVDELLDELHDAKFFSKLDL
jgi:hypothetical protein